MEKPKLVIPKKRYQSGTSVVSARLPNEMIEDLDRVARNTGHNRNEVITICLEYAIDNLEEPEEGRGNDQKKKKI